MIDRHKRHTLLRLIERSDIEILFGRSITPAGSADTAVGCTCHRHVEIDQADISLKRDHNIGRLDIAVDDGRREGMQIHQRFGDLFCPEEDLFLTELTAAFDIFIQRFTCDKVHHGIDAVIQVQKVICLRKILMLQVFDDIGFLSGIHHTDPRIIDTLDDHILLQSQMIGFIDRTSAPCADLLVNAVGIVYHASLLDHGSSSFGGDVQTAPYSKKLTGACAVSFAEKNIGTHRCFFPQMIFSLTKTAPHPF